MFGLGYNANSILELQDHFEFLSNIMASGGVVKLVVRGYIPSKISEIPESEVIDALKTHVLSNEIMRLISPLTGKTIGLYNINAKIQDFGFTNYRTRCAADYIGKV